MPGNFLADTGLLHPFRQIAVADVVVRDIEQPFIVIVILRLTYKPDKRIAQRNDYPAARAMAFRFLLLEPQCLCRVIHIAESKATGVAPPRSGV